MEGVESDSGERILDFLLGPSPQPAPSTAWTMIQSDAEVALLPWH